jgi:transposase-like protein
MKRKMNGKHIAKSVVLRHFKCQGCGTVRTAPKDHDTEANHIKDLYCPICNATTHHRQFDSDRYYLP